MTIWMRYICLALSSIAILWSALPSLAIDVGSLPALIFIEIDDEDSDADGAGGALFRPMEFPFVPADSSAVIKSRAGFFTKAARWTPMTVRGPPLV